MLLVKETLLLLMLLVVLVEFKRMNNDERTVCALRWCRAHISILCYCIVGGMGGQIIVWWDGICALL